MNNDWKEWINDRISLLSTPLGMGVSVCGFIIGILIVKFIQG